MPLAKPTMQARTLIRPIMMKAPMLMVVRSSGAPGGGVGADDEAGFALAEVGAARLDGGALVPEE